MACVPVEGDRILARDLPAQSPAFALWSPAIELGYAPAPGVRRVLRAAELERIARREGMPANSMADLCVERPAAPLTSDALEAALAAALNDPAVRIQILDWSRYSVPHGVLEFPRSSAVTEGTGPDAPVLWKGFVKYGEHGRYSIWVRARITTQATRVTATDALQPGRPIAPGQLRIDTILLSPFDAQPARALAEVVGRTPRRPVPAGSPIFLNQLKAPLEIHSGDPVVVRVTSGQAQLMLEGVAGGDGHGGDFIPVRNPATGRTFRARVQGAGRVAVEIPSTQPTPPGEK